LMEGPAVLLPHWRVMLRRGDCQTEHRHEQIYRGRCHDGHRYWQEFVPRYWPRSTRRDRVAAEVVARPGRSAARRNAPVHDRHGGLGRRPSLSRKLQALDPDVRLMPAKCGGADGKGQKNDFRDAEAIAEAVQRPTMKFVATKTAEQLDLQAGAKPRLS